MTLKHTVFMRAKLYIVLISILCLCNHWLEAQVVSFKGSVTNTEGKGIKDVKIIINRGKAILSSAKGEFEFLLLANTEPSVDALKTGYAMQNLVFDTKNRTLKILMQDAKNSFRGIVIDAARKPLKNAVVSLPETGGSVSCTTNFDGSFTMVLPVGFIVSKKTRFAINGANIPSSKVVFSANDTYVSLQLETQLSDNQTVNQLLVYDTNEKLLPGVHLYLDGKTYTSDAYGMIQTKEPIGLNSSIKADYYAIKKTELDPTIQAIKIHVVKDQNLANSSKTANPSKEEVETVEAIHKITDDLVEERAILEERGIKIKENIDKLAERLHSDKNLSKEAKTALSESLLAMEIALHDNVKAYKQENERAIELLKKELQLADSMHSAAQEELKVVTEEKKKVEEQSRLNLLIGIPLGIIVSLIAVFFYWISLRIRKQNQQLAIQADQLREANSQIKQTNEKLENQNTIIQTKNANITASITYAQRIQSSMLPQQSLIRRLLPHSFILFRPKDIVSGDFYWLTEKELADGSSRIVVAVVDCTGHGVPGAFMSMVADALLNQIVKLQGITSPDQVLTELHFGVTRTLRQDETDNRDGMDIALCTIDPKNKILEFSGAKSPLIFIQDKNLQELKANQISIGGRGRHLKARFANPDFTKQSVVLDKPTACYIFSDGYQDQFGGYEGKKFMKKNLTLLLKEVHALPFEKQKQTLEQRLNNWMEGHKQVDDILVVGFKIV
jgi:serine phosphatase RsbU (regulator of sigma subunit)